MFVHRGRVFYYGMVVPKMVKKIAKMIISVRDSSSRWLSASQYSFDFCARDSIYTFSCWIKFFCMETPAFDHVANCARRTFEKYRCLNCGEGLFHGWYYRQVGKFVNSQ